MGSNRCLFVLREESFMCNSTSQAHESGNVARYHLTYRQPRSDCFKERHLWLPIYTVEKARAAASAERNLILLFVTNALGFTPQTVTWEQIELVEIPMWGQRAITLAL